MIDEFKYKIGEEVSYNSYGELKSGKISEITSERVYYNNTDIYSTTVTYKIENDKSFDLVEERRIHPDINEEEIELIKIGKKIAVEYYRRRSEIHSLMHDCILYSDNNDWRFDQLKKLLDDYGKAVDFVGFREDDK